ncbi:cytochrome P450 6k1-like [Lycorma delicatula]|uniref:cytochrome P450 6k1-like n=1 Tax=Lycorma delicatula TaxID=130591 RepID=UPI003F51843A
MSDIVLGIYKQLEGEKFGGYKQFLTPVITICDPELINQILIKDFTYFEDRGPKVEKSVEIFNSNLGNLCGDEWRVARHKLTPTFSSGKLKIMFEPIRECCSEAVLYLKDNKNDVEAKGFISRLIIKIIANAAFGLKVDILNEEEAKNNQFFITSSKFLKPSIYLFLKLFVFISFPKVRNFLKFKLMDDDVDKFFRKLTKDITKQRQETGMRRNDFLQILLDQKKKEEINLRNQSTNVSNNDHEAEEPEDKEIFEQLKYMDNLSNDCSKPNVNVTVFSLTDYEYYGHYPNLVSIIIFLIFTKIFTEDFIASQTFLFISGGSETTATVLSFSLYELVMNPELQIKVQEENVLSSHEFNYDAVKEMKYLEQFIYETLRLHPILGTIIRYCTKDYKIPETDVVIEKGTIINIPVVGFHKDPQYFPNPEKFNPDRFQNMKENKYISLLKSFYIT